ncbi:MAG: hypothetical protein QOH66_2189 [Actinomycetota bacterium]|nr:hypothetical protein [Actinomycetota bacterium]
MRGAATIAGEREGIDCRLPWTARLIEECLGDDLSEEEPSDASVRIHVERERDPFDLDGFAVLTRGAWHRDGEVVLRNVGASGFDLRARPEGSQVDFFFRWRPPPSTRAISAGLRSRFHLIARAFLVQYPALWWAGLQGRVPLHAPVMQIGAMTPLLAGPGGVGKTTLLQAALAQGAAAISDNLCATDGTRAWGVLEPMRTESGPGRRMAHGRRELALSQRVATLVPNRVVVLQRGTGDEPTVASCSPDDAARTLVAGTYMAGELRRYWGFAATLALGTGLGPPHPAIGEVAATLTAGLPCIQISLGRYRGQQLSELLARAEVPQWR